jgi:hypothetical protein
MRQAHSVQPVASQHATYTLQRRRPTWQVEVFRSLQTAAAGSAPHRHETASPVTFGQLLTLLASPNPDGAHFRRFFNEAIATATNFGGAEMPQHATWRV